ncbi:MAG TPA: hypothetical protein VJ047_18520 [Pseudomonas sp.]|nr:hypothetical protein [Pseudomonas sp.]
MVVIRPSAIPFALGLALRQITVQLTRDGEQTPTPKLARMLSPGNLTLAAAFVAPDGYSAAQWFLASAVDGAYLILATDEVAPPRAAGRYVQITEDMTLAIDLNDGTGGGGTVGTPASLGASVRVAGLDAERTVVAVEQQSDGAWRVAGSGRTDAQGDAALDLRVTPSSLMYAMALDDWGTPFQIDQIVTVGMTIRPSVFAGWLYRITDAGTLPSTEPAWWPVDGDNAPRLLGTARAVAVRYYRPLAHGPVPVEVS